MDIENLENSICDGVGVCVCVRLPTHSRWKLIKILVWYLFD